MIPIRTAGADIGQPIDRRRLLDCQAERGRVNPDREAEAGLDRDCRPARLVEMRRAIARRLSRRVGHYRIRQVRARHIEGAEHQQQEYADGQRELNYCLTRVATTPREWSHDRGQILVVFAITAASLVAVIGVLYSFGLILSQRRAMQAAADAASLAGSWQVLAELQSDNRSDANVHASILRYATTNGATAANALYVDTNGTQLAVVGGGGQFPAGARGVRVTVSNNAPTILPGLLSSVGTLVQDTATAVARPTQPPASAAVIPIAVNSASVTLHASFDLFNNPPPGAAWATLDLAASGAPSFGPNSTNEQYWSDGQHLGNWQLSEPGTVNLADAAYYDSVAAGLRDNIRRQALVDAQSNAYALVTVPVYDSSSSSSVHVVGFAQMKLVGSTVTPTSAPATFVPYPVGAYGAPQVPTTDLGATFVVLVA